MPRKTLLPLPAPHPSPGVRETKYGTDKFLTITSAWMYWGQKKPEEIPGSWEKGKEMGLSGVQKMVRLEPSRALKAVAPSKVRYSPAAHSSV